MGSLGWPEILLIFIIALLIFGPRKLPQLGKSLGRAMGEFRRATNELKSSLEAEVSREEEKLHGDRRRQVEEAYSRPREQPGSRRPDELGPAEESGPPAVAGEGVRPPGAGDPSADQGDLFAPPGAPAAGSDLLPFGEGEEGARQPPPPGDEDEESLP